MVSNAFFFLRSACLALVCLTITVVGTQAMPFGEEFSGAEHSFHIVDGSLGNIHAHHSHDMSDDKKDAHAGHSDGCLTCLCCVMDYQVTIADRSDESAAAPPAEMRLFAAHSTREPLVPDRPPQHS